MAAPKVIVDRASIPLCCLQNTGTLHLILNYYMLVLQWRGAHNTAAALREHQKSKSLFLRAVCRERVQSVSSRGAICRCCNGRDTRRIMCWRALGWACEKHVLPAEEGTCSLIQSCCLQVLQWRETRHMAPALEDRRDSSVFSEAYCASLAAGPAPGCRLVEVFNSHGPFLPELAGQGGLQGDVISALSSFFARLMVGSDWKMR